MGRVSTTSALNPLRHRRITFVIHLSHPFLLQLVSPLLAQELRVTQVHDLRRHGLRLPIRSLLVQSSHRLAKVRAKVIHLPASHRTGVPTNLTELRIPRVCTMPKDLLLAPDRHQDLCLPRHSLLPPVSVAQGLCPRRRLRGVGLRPPPLAAALVHICRPLSQLLLEVSGIIGNNSMKIRSIALVVPLVSKSNGFFKSPMPDPLLHTIEGPYTIRMRITPRDRPLLPPDTTLTLRVLLLPLDMIPSLRVPLPLAPDHPHCPAHLKEHRVPL